MFYICLFIILFVLFVFFMIVFISQVVDEIGCIMVIGEGFVLVVFDLVIVNFGVLKIVFMVCQVFDDVNKVFVDMIVNFKFKGIEVCDLQIFGFLVFLQFDYFGKNGIGFKFIGYQVFNMLMICVCDIGVLGKVLDDVVINGINLGGLLSFGNSKQKEFVVEVCKVVVVDVIVKVKVFIEVVGVMIGDVFLILEDLLMVCLFVLMVCMVMVKEVMDSVLVEVGESEYYVSVMVIFVINQVKF